MERLYSLMHVIRNFPLLINTKIAITMTLIKLKTLILALVLTNKSVLNDLLVQPAISVIFKTLSNIPPPPNIFF